MLVEPCSALKSAFTPFSSVIGWNKINPDDHHICVAPTYWLEGQQGVTNVHLQCCNPPPEGEKEASAWL